MNDAEEPAIVNDIPDTAIVTGGETSDDDAMEHAAEGNESDEEPRFPRTDELYDVNADDEDEAYVYSHLRSGVEESVRIQQPNSQQTIEDLKVLKPRNSDAILSCPCCFVIVCMDCQRHERYPNQFRAMFVMNIAVKWDHRLIYDERQKMLMEYTNNNSSNSNNNSKQSPVSRPGATTAQQQKQERQEEIYYTVCCANCTTTVAALDMEDEVYHFYGCLATS